MTISITELSTYLGVSPATIERWVKQGKLLAYSKGEDDLKFRIKEVKLWAARQNIRLNIPEDGKDSPVEGRVISLSRAVRNGGVYTDIQGDDKAAILKSCVEKLDHIPEDFKQDLLERLFDRERALSTGIGNGIAIPHPRDPLVYLPHPMVMACFLETPVDYQALDQKPVSILFIILSNTLKSHLPLLSALSMCLKDKEFSIFLTSKPDLDSLSDRIETLLAH
ncbi:PTS sugar transporter subunit IIA [Desulfospira joergensenii]|uniref:PTS sugar transporter subunit IIA n=1 Tax=Desulfospira joergensenii TaxID=53329 RepID=UPI0003B7AC9F|nr:PTS sugar transporter subunit IIA [Desulfospira joergensenii]